ncbi:cytochrome P450 [Streptomyces tropicalis]|uniref:Cytochrome P450 n=1 Tax=Streptomyces tropicalis TaxID=3034234 RepID=A0ABT6A865_9ACTN|nr:cytochrome P450 [Streptomyces tropicalis]MDF3300836.1 cytochrome P450 [Streptomyces tropicalis]
MAGTAAPVPSPPLADGVRAPEWDEGLDCWVVTDPRLAQQVLHHPGFASGTFERSFQLYMTDASRAEYRELTEFLRLWFVQADAPEHTSLRRPVQRMLSASYVRSLAPRVEEITDECLTELAAARPQDVVPTVAEGISGRVMAHVVGIDVPPPVLHRWSQTLSLFIGAMYRRDHAQAAHRVMVEMSEALAGARALEGFPAGTPADRARTTATWAMCLFGGLETTASLLGSTVLTALGDRALWETVTRDADGAVSGVVESVLVGRPPLRHLGRVVAYDQEIAGARLRRGDLVLVSLTGQGPLDEAGAGAPGGCPVTGAGGDRNLVFGKGPHYCVGAPLARLEAAVLLRRLAARFPDARLGEEAAVWGPNLSYVGLDHLYVDLGREV